MPRDSFQQELDNLVAGMLDLGRQVEASLENMVGAMERRDAGLAGKELGVDDAIDAAYRTKYHRYADSYVTHMNRPEARAMTIKLIPR